MLHMSAGLGSSSVADSHSKLCGQAKLSIEYTVYIISNRIVLPTFWQLQYISYGFESAIWIFHKAFDNLSHAIINIFHVRI